MTPFSFDFAISTLDMLVGTFSGITDSLSGSYGDMLTDTINAVSDPAVKSFFEAVKLIADNASFYGTSISDLSLLTVMVGSGLLLYVVLQIISWIKSVLPFV